LFIIFVQNLTGFSILAQAINNNVFSPYVWNGRKQYCYNTSNEKSRKAIKPNNKNLFCYYVLEYWYCLPCWSNASWGEISLIKEEWEVKRRLLGIFKGSNTARSSLRATTHSYVWLGVHMSELLKSKSRQYAQMFQKLDIQNLETFCISKTMEPNLN